MVKAKPRKKTERQKLVARLDRAFSKYIRARDGYCALSQYPEQAKSCGGVLQCGHLYSRAAYSTRWNPKNAFGLCGGHNLLMEHNHAVWIAFKMHAIAMLGEEEVNQLEREHNTPHKYSNSDLRELITEYEGRGSGTK